MTALLHTAPLTTVLLVVGIVLLRPFAARLRADDAHVHPLYPLAIRSEKVVHYFGSRGSWGPFGDHTPCTPRNVPTSRDTQVFTHTCVTCRNSSEAVLGVKWFALIRLYWNRRRRTSDAALIRGCFSRSAAGSGVGGVRGDPKPRRPVLLGEGLFDLVEAQSVAGVLVARLAKFAQRAMITSAAQHRQGSR
jgi:hypothetical protein